MIKNIFIISIIALFLVLVFFGIYNFVFRDINIKQTVNKKEKINVEESSFKKIIPITEDAVVGATLDSSKKRIIFYDKNNGNLKEVSFDGTIKRLIFENNISNLIDVTWSPDKSFAITSFENNYDKKFYLYSYITRKSTELKSGIDSIVWDNQGEKTIYKYFNKEKKERTLNISDPNGKNWKKLNALGDKFKNAYFFHVPQTLFVSFWNYPDALAKTSLNKVSLLEAESSEELLSDKFGANYMWSPNGRSVLVSSVDKGGYNLKLEIKDIDDSNYKNLGIPTIVDKCIWSDDGEYVFCAVPVELPENSIMPNDYQDKKLFTKDVFWKINVNNGKKEKIVEYDELLGDSYDAHKLFLSPKEDMLFFINRYDDKIYRIAL